MSEEIKQFIDPGKKNLVLIYILYLLGIIMLIFPLIGAFFSFANLKNPNIIWQSHYIFAFRTFIIGCTAFAVKFVNLTFIGPILYIALFVLFIVRGVFALQFILEEKAHPNSLTFWIK